MMGPSALQALRGAAARRPGRAFERETMDTHGLTELGCRDVRFHACQFQHCDFRGLTFMDARFKAVRFTACRFCKKLFSAQPDLAADGADFRKARFKDCTLADDLIRYANLNNSVFERTQVRL